MLSRYSYGLDACLSITDSDVRFFLFFIFFWVKRNRVHYYWSHYRVIVRVQDDDGLWGLWSSRWNYWQKKAKYPEQTCPNVVLSTTNPTWPDLGSNPGSRGGKPGTNSLSYSTDCMRFFSSPKRPDRLWCPPSLLSNPVCTEGSFPSR
jgi:hypothetical protein